ncbi:MAG: hypothetical protein WBA57_09295 [Elainellaceae cyanobacterium]
MHRPIQRIMAEDEGDRHSSHSTTVDLQRPYAYALSLSCSLG